jgi:L-ribulose-5-phosphate 3-epimerase
MARTVGFMQGRLSDPIDNRIQSFPWYTWEDEFAVAAELGFELLEWTIDADNLSKNPIMSADGQQKINELKKKFNINIRSLTGDCFMQTPFWKTNSSEKKVFLESEFLKVCQASAKINIELIVVPLVDNGRLENRRQEDDLVGFLVEKSSFFKNLGLKITFESDYEPFAVKRLISQLDPTVFGINYDIGNSASLGFDVCNEFENYGDRILNVHIKDRTYQGSTVPLGEGDAKFEDVFKDLNTVNYQGDFILQTARDANGNHANALITYRAMTQHWISKYLTT